MDEDDRLQRLKRSIVGFTALLIVSIVNLSFVHQYYLKREKLIYLGSIAASINAFENSEELGNIQAVTRLTSPIILGSAENVERAVQEKYDGCLSSAPEDICVTVGRFTESVKFLADRFGLENSLAPRYGLANVPETVGKFGSIFMPHGSQIKSLFGPIDADLYLEVRFGGTPVGRGGIAILAERDNDNVSAAVPISELPIKRSEITCFDFNCVDLQHDEDLERAIQNLRLRGDRSELDGKYFIIGKRELNILVLEEFGDDLKPSEPDALVEQIRMVLAKSQETLKISGFTLDYKTFLAGALAVFIYNLVYLQFFLPALTVRTSSSDKKYWILRDYHGPLQFLAALFLAISPLLCLLTISVTALAVNNSSIAVFGYFIKINPLMNEYSISERLSRDLEELLAFVGVDWFLTLQLVLVTVLFAMTFRPTFHLIRFLLLKK